MSGVMTSKPGVYPPIFVVKANVKVKMKKRMYETQYFGLDKA